MIKKRNWLLIILCAYYFFYSLKSLVDTVISFMVIRTGHVNNTDALYVNNYFLLILFIQTLSYITLFFVCVKRKRVSLKLVPILGILIWILPFIYSFVAVYAKLFTSYSFFDLFVGFGLQLLVPIIATGVIYQERKEFVK